MTVENAEDNKDCAEKERGEKMGVFVNPGNEAFAVALNSEIYVDKTGLLTYTNKVMNTLQGYICNWYFATALAKQWDRMVIWLEECRLPEWVHRKTIQKAVESYRITPERKEYLRGLRSGLSRA